MQEAMNYPKESQIMALQPQEFVNIRQTQEQINLLKRIANAISEDSSRSILSRLIILILLISLYGWLAYDFYDDNGFTHEGYHRFILYDYRCFCCPMRFNNPKYI